MGAEPSPGKGVDSASNALELARCDEAAERDRGHTLRLDVTCAKQGMPACEREHLGIVG